MGITSNDMVLLDDFDYVAGRAGFHKTIENILTLDGGYENYQIRQGDFLVSTGRLTLEDPQYFLKLSENDCFKNLAGIGLKLGVYIDQMPEELIEACEIYQVPLLSINPKANWIEIIRDLNIAVMNKVMNDLKISGIDCLKVNHESYQVMKLKNVLLELEEYSGLKAFIYDNKKDIYHKSSKDIENPDSYFKTKGLEEQVIYDKLNIVRYVDSRGRSFINLPINVNGDLKASLIIIEGSYRINYFDEIVLRLAYVLVQSVYESICLSNIFKNREFERFLNTLRQGHPLSQDEIISTLDGVGLDVNQKLSLLYFKYKEEDREAIEYIYSNTMSRLGGNIGLLQNEGVVVFYSDTVFSIVDKSYKDFNQRLKRKGIDLKYGYSNLAFEAKDFPLGLDRGIRAYEVGSLIYPDQETIWYDSLGVLGWIDLKEDEYSSVAEGIKVLENHEDKDLIRTLSIYLDSNLNYSLTAKELFVHVNTVRKRINEIESKIDFQLDDPVDRMKLQLILKLILKEEG